MASAFCNQLRQYVKQLVSNPQPCLVSQTARLHVGDARNRFYSLLHSWGSEKPPEPPRKRSAGSLPLVLTVNELKFVVLREDVALPLQPPHGTRQLNARPRGRFPEPSRAECHQQNETCEKTKPINKPTYVNPEPEPGNKPNPELESSPRSEPTQATPAQPRDRCPPAKPTGTYAAPVKFYREVRSPMAKMSEPLDFARRNPLSASSRNLSTLPANSVSKGGLVEAVTNSQIKGFHASAANNKEKKDRDRDRSRDRDKDRERKRREMDRVRSVYGDVDPEMRRDDERRADSRREGGRTICAGKKPDPPPCPEECRCSPSSSPSREPGARREPDARRSSVREPDSRGDASVRESDSRRGASVRECDSRRGASVGESDSRRGASVGESESRRGESVKEPEWRRKASMREPHSRRPAAPVEEPRSGDEGSARSKCSGNPPWKRECPGSNRLRKCPGGSCGRGDRDPERKAFSSYTLRSRTKIPILHNLKVSKSEITRSLGSSDVIYAKKKGSCEDKYSLIKDKKRRMKLMERELDEIKNCIESVKGKLRRSPKEGKGSNKKS